MLASQTKDGNLLLSFKKINTIPWVRGCHMCKYGPSSGIVCPLIPPIFSFLMMVVETEKIDLQ